MSLETILERIRAAGELKIQEIRARSESEVQACMNDAQMENEHLFQEAYNLALEPAAGERARALNQAHYEAMCFVGKARESLVDDVIAETTRQLEDIRSKPDEYSVTLRKILLETLPGQNGMKSAEERIILEADPRDKVLLETILEEKNLSLHIEYTLHCWGGLIARTQDGTTRIINTLESRMERALPYLKRHLITLFEQKEAVEAVEKTVEHVKLG